LGRSATEKKTLFNYASKDVVSITGITFTVLLGHDKHLQVCEWPVAVWEVTSDEPSVFTTSRGLRTFYSKLSRPNETRSNNIRCGKSTKK
jgi:hypothetical protein